MQQEQQQTATVTTTATTRMPLAGPVTTRPKPYTAAELVQALRNGMITCDKPKQTKSATAWTFYPKSKDRGDTAPVIMLPKMIAPFLPSVPKQKQGSIEAWTDYNLELSVGAEDTDIIQMSAECEAFSDSKIEANTATIYPGIHPMVVASYHAPCMRLTKKQKASDPTGFPRLFRLKVHPTNTKFLKYTGQSETGRLQYTLGCFEDLQPYCPVVPCVTWATCFASTTSHGCKFFTNSILIFPPLKLGQMSGEEAVDVFSAFADQAPDMMTTSVDGKSAMAAFGSSTSDDISNDNDSGSSVTKTAGGGAGNVYDAYENDEDDDM